VNTIGIDVDSVNLVCRIRRNGKDFPETIFSNDAAGHQKLIRWATRRGKTDSMDAVTILNFLERMPSEARHAPSTELLEIQHICRRVVQLNAEVSRERNRHLAAKRVGPHGRVVANDTLVTMKPLQRRIVLLEQAALELISSIPVLADKFATITSATGIARKTGPRIVAEILVLPRDMLAPQWVAHAG